MTFVKIKNPKPDFYTYAERWLDDIVDTVESDAAPEGYLRLDDSEDYPVPAPGEITAMHVSIDNDILHLDYVAMRPDDPRIAPPRNAELSKRRLANSLKALGLWEAVKAYMQQGGMWEDFELSTTLMERDEMMQAGFSALKLAFGLTDEQIEQLINDSVAR